MQAQIVLQAVSHKNFFAYISSSGKSYTII